MSTSDEYTPPIWHILLHRIDMANSKNNEPICVTARQVETFLYSRNGKLTSRDYDKLMRMKLVKSSVRDVIWELKQYSVETLAHCLDVGHLGRGKHASI